MLQVWWVGTVVYLPLSKLLDHEWSVVSTDNWVTNLQADTHYEFCPHMSSSQPEIGGTIAHTGYLLCRYCVDIV